MKELYLSLRRNTLGIALFAAVTAGLIALTQVLTADRIQHNREEHQARALYEILPRELDDQLHLRYLTLDAPELGLSTPLTLNRALSEGEIQAVILPITAHDGYSGDIRLLVGIWRDGRVAGVRVLEHRETPGLGDRIELAKSDWILSFNDMQWLGEQDTRWAVRRDGGDFDAFTGATITPRAIVNAVARSLQFFHLRRDELLALPHTVHEEMQLEY